MTVDNEFLRECSSFSIFNRQFPIGYDFYQLVYFLSVGLYMDVALKNRNQEIVEAIRNGQNSLALHYLYESALPHIIKYISQNSGDEDEAKDIFQDAVVALFTTIKLGKFDEEKDPRAFLYHVARNLWINRIKKRNRQFDISKMQPQVSEESPLSVVITSEKQEAIEKLMELAGTKCKELLKYSLYDDMSMKEIAAIMGFSGENVAKSTHYRCKQKLIELVQNDQDLIRIFKE